MTVIGDHLRALRTRAGLSMEEMAEKLSFARASSYQYYESATGYSRDRLPRHLIEKLKKALVGTGEPPITDADIDAVHSDNPPQGETGFAVGKPTDLKLVGAHADAVRLLLQQSYGVAFTRVPAFNLATDQDVKLLVARKPTRRSEYFPSTWLNDIANTGSFVLVRQAGNQMEPTIGDHDWMLFDWAVNRVAFPGVYLISYDNDMIVGRCQRDPSSKDIVVTMDSNSYQPLRIPPDANAAVVGRLLWVGKRF